MLILQGSQQLLRALELYDLFQFNIFYKNLKNSEKKGCNIHIHVLYYEYLVRWSSG